MSQPQMKLSLANLEFLDLPNLLINIWEYNDETYKNCLVCKQYEAWCIQLVKTQWQNNYMDFDFVIDNIKQQNRKLFDFGKISNQDRAKFYRLTWKNRF